MVQSDLGVYVISSLQKNLLPRGVTMRAFEEHFTRPVGLAVKSIKTLTSIQRAFIDTTVESFSHELKLPGFDIDDHRSWI